MEKITLAEYKSATAYLAQHPNRRLIAERIGYSGPVDIIIGDNGQYIYFCQNEEPKKKYFKVHADEILTLYKSMRYLYLRDVTVGGQPVDSITIGFGSVLLPFELLRGLFENVEKARRKP